MSSGSSSPTRDAHEVRRHARGGELFGRELAVRGRRRVDHERAGVADVGQVAAELHGLDEPLARGPAARHPEREHRARALREVPARRGRGRGGRAGPPTTRSDTRGSAASHSATARALATCAVHPLRQRLHALEQQERAVRRERGADVAQLLGAQLGEEAVLVEVAPPRQPAVGRDGLGHRREAAVAPVEPPRLDDHAAERGAVAAEELGGRVDHDVGAVLDRAAQVGRGHGGVDDQRHAGVVGDLGDAREVGDLAGRVGDHLGEHQLGGRGDRRGDVGGLAARTRTSVSTPKRRSVTSSCVIVPP